MNFVQTIESAFAEYQKKLKEFRSYFKLTTQPSGETVIFNKAGTPLEKIFSCQEEAIAWVNQMAQKEFAKPFIIGVRFISGATEVILVEEATDGYILGRIRMTKGAFSKTIRTIQTATIEYFERVEK